MNTYLLLDQSNLLHRNFFATWKLHSEDDLAAGMSIHSAFVTINKYVKMFNPDKIVAAFDRPNWRKMYTKSDACISGKIYKGTRREQMTPNELVKYEQFIENIADFEEILKTHTSIVSLASEMLEADDLIAGFCEMHQDDQVIIISADNDMKQLLKYPNVRIFDPITDKEKIEEDPDYFMFLKCIRGDKSDNVASAFPRVRETRIKKAYLDPVERVNFMNETWTNEDEVTFKVGDLFEENKLLMDLHEQPEPIRKKMFKVIKEAKKNVGRYNHFKFLKFLGKHDLKRISENVDYYAKMLSL